MSVRQISYADAIREALREEMIRDRDVFLLGEDIRHRGAFGLTKGLADEFGEERVRNTPISESTFIGAALGAALTGLRPVAELMFCDLILCSMDSVANEAAKWNYMVGGGRKIPLTVRVGATGMSRGAGCHHSQSLEATFMHYPGLRMAVPSTPYDAKGLLKSSIRGNDPVLFFEHKMLYPAKGPVPETEYTIPFGVADVKREGKDVTILAVSWMVQKSLAAAEELAKAGISAEVIDPRTLVPLDKRRLIDSVKKTGRLVTVEEGCRTGGVGAEIAAIIADEAFDHLDAPIKRIANPDLLVPYAPENERLIIPDTPDIVRAVKEIV